MTRVSELPLLCLLLLPLVLQHICALPQPNAAVADLEPKQTAVTSSIEETTKAAIASTTATSANDDSEEESLSETLSQRLKLLTFTLDEFLVLSNFTVRQGVEIFKNVLKDATTLKEPSDVLHENLKNFTKFIERAEHLVQLSEEEQMTELFEMVVTFTEIVERHNTTLEGNNSTESLYLEMSLKKNGLDKLQVDFLQKFSDFLVRFDNEMDKYLTLLTAEERKGDVKMIDWYKTLKDESDAEAKLDLFTKFFDNY